MQSDLDRRRWSEMQHYTHPNPNPPQPPVEPYSHHLYYASHYTQNPSPHPNPYTPVETPSYASVGSLTHSHGGSYQAYAPSQIDAGPVAAPYGYYQEQRVVNAVQHWPIGVTIQHGSEQLVLPFTNSQAWSNATVHPHGTSHSKKAPRKTKIVQSVWCDLCKIDCNSKDMLDKHKSGKKHKKNLEKLKQIDNPQSSNPIIGPPENPNPGGKSRKKKAAAEPLEASETKRRKTGSVAGAGRRCDACNVLCNSDLVFQTHLVGRKHTTTMMKIRAKEGAI